MARAWTSCRLVPGCSLGHKPWSLASIGPSGLATACGHSTAAHGRVAAARRRRAVGCRLRHMHLCGLRSPPFYLTFLKKLLLFFVFFSLFYSLLSLFILSLPFHSTTLLIRAQFNNQNKLIPSQLENLYKLKKINLKFYRTWATNTSRATPDIPLYASC